MAKKSDQKDKVVASREALVAEAEERLKVETARLKEAVKVAKAELKAAQEATSDEDLTTTVDDTPLPPVEEPIVQGSVVT